MMAYMCRLTLLDSRWLFQILHVHSWERPLGSELLDFLSQLLDQPGTFLALLLGLP